MKTKLTSAQKSSGMSESRHRVRLWTTPPSWMYGMRRAALTQVTVADVAARFFSKSKWVSKCRAAHAMLDDDDALGVDAEALALVAAPRRVPVVQPSLKPKAHPPLSTPPPLSSPPKPSAPSAVSLSPPGKKDLHVAPTTEPPLTPKRQRTIEEALHLNATRESPGDGPVTVKELGQRLSPVKKDAAAASRPAPSSVVEDDFQRDGPWLAMCAERGLAPYATREDMGPLSCHIHFIQSGGVAVRQKVPELAVHVKSVAQQGLDAAVTVQDPSGEMEGTVHADVLSKYKGQVLPGAVLWLREVPLYIPTGHEVFLIVAVANVAAIYPPWTPAPAQPPAAPLCSWREQYLAAEPMSALHQARLQRGLLTSPAKRPGPPAPAATPKKPASPAAKAKAKAAPAPAAPPKSAAPLPPAPAPALASDDAIDAFLASAPDDLLT